MANSNRKVLFVSHAATRNGASILLLNLLSWLRDHSEFTPEILSYGNGPLIAEFRAVARTRILRQHDVLLRLADGGGSGLRARLASKLVRSLVGCGRYDLVYANTAATWNLVALLTEGRCPVLWHIHELPYALRLTLGKDERRLLLSASRLVAVSQSVVEVLTGEFSVPRERVDLVHEFIPVQDLSPIEKRAKRQRVLQSLGWPEDAFVVGGCGGLGWRKGTDLFVQIAHSTCRNAPKDCIRFLWVGGGDAEEKEALQFDHDVKVFQLEAKCRRVISTPDVRDYYCAMDVFALTSREDPFPLVMLEAGLEGLPVICFGSSGGGPEFVADDAGIVVPYSDVGAFAHAVDTVRTSRELRMRLGAGAKRKVKSSHNVETQGEKILASIRRCLAAP